MTAAKHMDPVVGVDMHMVQPPPPAPPVMLPVPFAGYLLDPADYGSCKVMINGLPRARAGTPGMGCPPHIPPGGMFVKPPTNECEMYQGSSTVVIEGDAAAAQGHQVLTCHDVGMPAPVRAWKKSPAKSLMMAAGVVLPIPGMPVMIGGAPTITASASASSEEEEEEDPPLETIEIQAFDGIEMPLVNERFELHLPNGDVEEGTLDDKGYVKITDVPAGYSLLVFPDVDAPPEGRARFAADPTLESNPAPVPLPDGSDVTHEVVRYDETIRGICARHGLVHWRGMWFDSSNDELRSKRNDPGVLAPGDVVHVRVPSTPRVVYLSHGVPIRSGEKAVVHVRQWPRRFHFSG